MIEKTIYKKFKKGSITYFYSSLFFPKDVKEDIFILYAFVRTADNIVDTIPQDKENFENFCQKYNNSLKKIRSNDVIIDTFIKLKNKYRFDNRQINAFLESMKSDLYKRNFQTQKEVDKYMYGSAEVIGLMMSKIMKLPKISYPYAKMLGKAMQFANFIRDIEVDNKMKRSYIPLKDLKKFGLRKVNKKTVKNYPDRFRNLIDYECSKYIKWQNEAEKGFKYIPKRFLIPIKTASDMYKWTIEKIINNPMIIFEKQVKPSPVRVVLTIIKNALSLNPTFIK